MLISKYDYPELRRIQTKKGRQYVGEDDNPVPSVTTILGDTGDKTALIAWRKRVGEQEANRISQESAGLGTKVHNALEKHILGEDVSFGNNHISVMAESMTNQMLNNGLNKVDELYGVEVGLIAQGLYAGTSDAIGMYEGEEAIIDFKTAKKIKKREWIEDYFMQASAYALAHNEVYGTNIQKGVIFMVTHDNEYQQFVVEGDEFQTFTNKWLDRVETYYKMNK